MSVNVCMFWGEIGPKRLNGVVFERSCHNTMVKNVEVSLLKVLGIHGKQFRE